MIRIANLIGAVDRLIQHIEVLLLSTCVLAMAINSIANVMGRYIFQNSLFFSEELNQFLMLIITFVGLGYITRQGRHIRMSAIYDMMAEKPKKYLMLLICVSTACTMFLLAYYSYEYVVKLASRGQVTPALRVPVYLTLIFIPAGFAITGIQFLLAFFKNIVSEGIFISYSQLDAYDDDSDIDSSNTHTENKTTLKPVTFQSKQL